MGGPAGRTSRMGSHAQDHDFPADLYLEGSDQHRGWFHSSLLISSMVNGVPPYKALLTHGFAVDGEGRKMSKSKGNVVAPQKVSEYAGRGSPSPVGRPPPTTRASCPISDEILKRVVESYRRIRNTLRFLLANTADFDRIVTRCRSRNGWRSTASARRAGNRMAAAVAADYARYEFHFVAQKLQTYLLRGPGRLLPRYAQGPALYDRAPTAAARRSAQNALYQIRDTCCD